MVKAILSRIRSFFVLSIGVGILSRNVFVLHHQFETTFLELPEIPSTISVSVIDMKPLETSFDQLPKMRLHVSLVDRNPIDKTLQRTTAGVDIIDPNLYVGEDYKGDSSTATVMGMASGYKLKVYQRFVGSLRKSGFQGHIILGVSPDVSPAILDYFEYRNVTAKVLEMAPCTFTNETQCVSPYLDIKTRWSRFILQRDWLRDCPTCTGPVLTTDVRDTFFQLDPFGPGSPVVKGLFVMEEDVSQRTTHWLTDAPFRECKGIRLDQVMLCSGTTVGTRLAILKYFEVMYAEMKAWSVDPECRFGFHGDDQSIHNYLYYSGQLPFATSWPNRAGGIVNTIGVVGAKMHRNHTTTMKELNKTLTKGQAAKIPYPGAVKGKHFLGLEYNLTNEEGRFTEVDGSVSRVVHQYDRFGPSAIQWLNQLDILQDPFPL